MLWHFWWRLLCQYLSMSHKETTLNCIYLIILSKLGITVILQTFQWNHPKPTMKCSESFMFATAIVNSDKTCIRKCIYNLTSRLSTTTNLIAQCTLSSAAYTTSILHKSWISVNFQILSLENVHWTPQTDHSILSIVLLNLFMLTLT